MRVALDAMGAERGVGIVIKGALGAIHKNPQIEVSIVGDKERIEKEIGKLNLSSPPFSIVAASQIITMSDPATAVLKEKKDSSIAVALDMIKKGEAQTFVSSGNTGAVMTASLLKLGRIKGVNRPCLAAFFPTLDGRKVVLLDVGANVDCKPVHLSQFALMGSIYAHKVLKEKSPRVALLNVGSEESKGNDLLIETFKLLKRSSLNFVGNIEGKDIISGKAEVVVCNGFVGNVILKFAESFATTTLNIIGEKAKKSFLGLGGLFARGWLKEISSILDYAEYGGVPLLGTNGICIIAHGASSSKAIKNAILAGLEFDKMGVNKDIEDTLSRMNKR